MREPAVLGSVQRGSRMPHRNTPEFRRRILDLIAAGRSVASIANELGAKEQLATTLIETPQTGSLSLPTHMRHKAGTSAKATGRKV